MSSGPGSSSLPNPLAQSPVFAALVHAASKAKSVENTPNLSARDDPFMDDDSSDGFALDAAGAYSSGSNRDRARGRRRSWSGDNFSPDGGATLGSGSVRRKRAPASRSAGVFGSMGTLGRSPGDHPLGFASKRPKASSSVTTGPSKGGSSCHQCKSRRATHDLSFCTSRLDRRKTCRKKYCDHCLSKFYKELPAGADGRSTANWVCPSCRKICCCAACRRKELKARAKCMAVNGVDASPKLGAAGAGNFDAVLDAEESRLMSLVRAEPAAASGPANSLAVTPSSSPQPRSAGAAPPRLARRQPSVANVQDPTLTYVLALSSLSSVRAMIGRLAAREDTKPHEKVQLISLLLRRIHQKYNRSVGPNPAYAPTGMSI